MKLSLRHAKEARQVLQGVDEPAGTVTLYQPLNISLASGMQRPGNPDEPRRIPSSGIGANGGQSLGDDSLNLAVQVYLLRECTLCLLWSLWIAEQPQQPCATRDGINSLLMAHISNDPD
jgi:hypothetical protein